MDNRNIKCKYHVDLDISKIPFSRYGAYIALFDDQTGALSIFWPMRLFRDKAYKMHFLYEGKFVIPTFQADPISLHVRYQNAWARIYIKTDHSVQVESNGFEYMLHPTDKDCYGTQHPGNRFEIISFSKHYYATTKLYCGIGTLVSPDGSNSTPPQLHIACPNPSQRTLFIFHLAEEQEDFRDASIDIPGDLAALSQEWDNFASKMPPVRSEHIPFALTSWYNLWSSFIRKSAMIPYDIALMSKKKMCAVWSWDHCFNALALQNSDSKMSYEQFILPYLFQSSTGALPDLVSYNNEVYYGVTKPPIHGWAFLKIWQANPNLSSEQLHFSYDAMVKQTNWWFRYRDSDGDGIPDYPQGCDSGADNASSFGELGHFVESPDLPAYLILQMNTLQKLASALGLEDDADQWAQRRSDFMQTFLDHSLVSKHFVSKKSRSHEVAKNAQTFLELMPLVLGDLLDPNIIDSLIHRLKERHLTDYGIASEAFENTGYYQSDGYWLGPIWAPITYLIIDGLKRAGKKKLAKEVAEKYLHMVIDIAKGNYENFDALTGSGLRAPGYTWTASVTLLLMHEIYLGEFE